jgi:Gram-negative bacterial TonB protein C-terminal
VPVLLEAKSCLRNQASQLKVPAPKLGWWNWQTRTFEGRMPKGVRVQVPPRALVPIRVCGRLVQLASDIAVPQSSRDTRRMNRAFVAILPLILCTFSTANAETLRDRDATYTWDSRDWRWDKRKFDTPPMPVGGYAALVKQLSYPSVLRSRGIEGRGVAIISFDSSGCVRAISFSPRMAPQLEQIVITAVSRTRFLPARRAGKPVAFKARLPVAFIAGR